MKKRGMIVPERSVTAWYREEDGTTTLTLECGHYAPSDEKAVPQRVPCWKCAQIAKGIRPL